MHPENSSNCPVEDGDDLRMLLEGMGVAVNEAELEGLKYVRVNRKMCELTGYGEKALLEKTIEEITHPEDWPREAAAMRQLATGEIEQYCAAKRFIRKNGELVWGRLIATVRRDRSGKAFRRISVVQDIHKERMAREEKLKQEAKLRASLGRKTRYKVLLEGQLKALEMICGDHPLNTVLEGLVRLAESVSVGQVVGSVLLLDHDGIHLRHAASPGLPQEYTLAVDGEAIGDCAGSCGTAAFRGKTVVVRDIEKDPLWQNYRKIARLLVRKPGLRACWSTPILDPEGKVLGSFAMYSPESRDPDARNLEVLSVVGRTAAISILKHRADRACAESEARLKVLADNMAQLAWLADEAGGRSWFNQRWLDFTGMTLREAQGLGWKKAHDPQDDQRVLDEFLRCAKTGKPFQDTYALREKGGSYRWFLSRAVPIRHYERKVNHWFGTDTDVTELRDAQEALRQSEARLEQQVAQRTAKLEQTVGELETISYGIIHDLRAPLRAINSYCKMLMEEEFSRVSAEGKMYLEGIMGSSLRMDKLVMDVLSYSDAIRTELKLEPVDVDKLVRGILESYPEFRESKGQIEIEGVLPTLMSNEAGLTLCISELLRNGLKFVAPGVTPHVRVRAETMEALPEGPASGTNPVQSGQRGRFRLWFEDNGIGIPRGYWERAFQMFQRLDKRYEGTGIGLAVVKKCCERMAAKIRLESEPGQGSKFGIEFPTGEYPMPGKAEADRLRRCFADTE